MLFRGRFYPRAKFLYLTASLHANSVGHLKQIDSYAPGHQISFGNLNYATDIRGDLIFKGFTAPTAALALDPEQTTRSEDGNIEPARLPAVRELATGDLEGTALSANPSSLVAKVLDSHLGL